MIVLHFIVTYIYFLLTTYYNICLHCTRRVGTLLRNIHNNRGIYMKYFALNIKNWIFKSSVASILLWKLIKVFTIDRVFYLAVLIMKMWDWFVQMVSTQPISYCSYTHTSSSTWFSKVISQLFHTDTHTHYE